jgi:hypothetical protein
VSADASLILPACTPRVTRNVQFRQVTDWSGTTHSIPYVPIFCTSCGADGGWVPEESKQFCHYLCDDCQDSYAPQVGELCVPDELFWKHVAEAQLETYGRIPTAVEVAESLKLPDSLESNLARDRDAFRALAR